MPARQTDTLFLACTRPAMFLGIPIQAFGVLIIGFLRNGLNLLQVSPFVQQVIIGLVIAIAVAADTMRRKRG